MKIAILGYGVEGKSVERYFSKNPENEIEIFDKITKEDIPKLGLNRFDWVFRAPSLHPFPADNLTSATRYFFDNCPAPIIGVTGTKGKGTTCSFTAAILKALGKNVHFLGNVGVPSLDVLDTIEPDDIVVYEMSSFQLWDLHKSPHVSVVLRIEPDHLDVHDSFEDYVNAKANIVRWQTPNDYCIYYKNDADSTRIGHLGEGKKRTYPYEVSPKLNEILNHIQVPGAHNRENAEAAILVVASFLEMDVETFVNKYGAEIVKGIESFHGLPHHIEFVREIGGIKYYDDSYSATYPSLEVAVRAFPNDRIILIAGGKDRGLDLSGNKRVISDEKNLIKTILIGETKNRLAEGIDESRYEFADTLDEALKKANAAAKALGANIVLLSPGAPSFDMFKNFIERGEIFQELVKAQEKVDKFKFLNYSFDENTGVATFNYQDSTAQLFSEKIEFKKPENDNYDKEALRRALELCFILLGTSYYKAHPTREVELSESIQLDAFQANFFNTVYQEGLSQYAFENHLTRADLAHFTADKIIATPAPEYAGEGIITLESGGKDSLLMAELLKEQGKPFTPLYISNSDVHPAVLDTFDEPLATIRRHVDVAALKATGGLNGHVPITYIVESIALVQAVLMNKNVVLASIGQEGNEAHAEIGDLKVNHQWSKTWPAEQALAEYVDKYVAGNMKVGSILRQYSELKIAELFVNKCWQKYGQSFSSCNVANYRQQADNQTLSWCGNCAKCANSYLLFAPFLNPEELRKTFNGQDLFKNENLINDFKGLLGIDGVIKPFECVGEVKELRAAYHRRQDKASALPFEVPESDFDYNQTYPHQDLI